MVQVKGVTYPLAELLDEDASRFEGGAAYCLRLESGHHHRVYCFDDGVLEEENSVPGGTTRCMRRPSPTCRACTPRTTG